MTNVKLHGELAEAIGKAEWQVSLREPREAIAAIEANTGKLYQYLAQRHTESGGAVEYRVLIDGKDIGVPGQDIRLGFYVAGDYHQIDIIPVLGGAGGLWQTIIGAVLVVIGVVLFFVPGFQGVAPFVLLAGIGMLAGGIAQMLSPAPKLGAAGNSFARSFLPPDETSGQAAEATGGKVNYLFSGVVNTREQGLPVPVCFGGPIRTGGAVISMSVTGTTVGMEQLVRDRPPKPADVFFDLPVWARLAADERAELVTPHSVVKSASVQTVLQTLVPSFGLPAVYNAEFAQRVGNPIPVGNTKLQRNTLRGYLSTIAFLFSGDPRQIKFEEAADLYRILEVGDTTNLHRRAWKVVVYELAVFFSPEP